MAEHEWLAEQFEAQRTHLRAVAYRILGSPSEADDAVQEAWLHLSRSDTSSVQNLGGWLTTVVARVCLDMLRSRTSRREDPLDTTTYEPEGSAEDESDPEHEAVMADSVGLALLVVLETLTPAERLAFVLHDLFDVPFEEIAPIVGRTPMAARQLASRARRRVRGVEPASDADLAHQRELVQAFLAASRSGDFAGLITVLDPNVVFRADDTAAAIGSQKEVHGADAIARLFAGRAQGAQPALVDGAVGIAVATGEQVHMIINLTIIQGKIVEMDVVADPARLAQMRVVLLPR